MKNINAYITFADNRTAEAMSFYQSVLGGELSFMKISETSIADTFPAELQDSIMHSSLSKDGRSILMGSDLSGPDGINLGNAMGIVIDCESEEEIHRLFNGLSEGGTVGCPVQDSFWGALFTHFNDKYGVAWMLNFDKGGQA